MTKPVRTPDLSYLALVDLRSQVTLEAHLAVLMTTDQGAGITLRIIAVADLTRKLGSINLLLFIFVLLIN